LTVSDHRAEVARTNDPALAEAYRACTEIARTQARNFYYAFLALPRAKRDAICAVYAFMRHADDISDDESRTREQRRDALDSWLEDWHRAAAGGSTADPVFAALADARWRFQIPMELLDQLVQGTAMDLHSGNARDRAHTASPETLLYDTYATFEELRRYCYYVASVVGLVCIRIFGYSDPRAESLAEDTGVAFQLTNILRDVREDAERGRVYLPIEDLHRHSVRINELTEVRDGSQMNLNQRELLEGIARRAEDYYESANRLLPMIAADARPALWVLITIYHDLLRRIEARDYDVFSERVTVPVSTRIAILVRGLIQVARNRLTGRE
jgi:15-cis-phytoene synthase